MLLISVVFIPSRGTTDVPVWVEFVEQIRKIDKCVSLQDCLHMASRYDVSNYPPGYTVAMYLLNNAPGIRQTSAFIAVKTIIFLFYLLSLASVVFYARSISASKQVLVGAAFLFVSATSLLINAMGLGYVDVFMIPFFILGALFIKKKQYYIAGICITLSVLMKWQPLIIVPFILLHVYLSGRFRGVVLFMGGAASTLLLMNIFTPNLFSVLQKPTSFAFGDRIISAAPNIPWIFVYILQKTGFSKYIGGYEMVYVYADQASHPILSLFYDVFRFSFIAYYGMLLYRYFTKYRETPARYDHMLLFIVFVMFGYFILSSHVHENHLLLGVVSALLLVIENPTRTYRELFIATNIVATFSMVVFYGVFGEPFVPMIPWGTSIVTIGAVVTAAWFARFAYRRI